jgi:hypothetical protein
MDWKKITKKQFDDAYNQHLPNGWIRFAYKYFSKSTERENLKPSRIIVGILLSLFGIGMLGTILKWSRAVVGTVTIAYSVILAVLVLYLLSAVWMNNARLKKVMKILGVTKQEYNLLVDKFYGSV